jgi:hypothetical protein
MLGTKTSYFARFFLFWDDLLGRAKLDFQAKKKHLLKRSAFCDPDGTRTRDHLRDRQVF